jgi:hypothetical protein
MKPMTVIVLPGAASAETFIVDLPNGVYPTARRHRPGAPRLLGHLLAADDRTTQWTDHERRELERS